MESHGFEYDGMKSERITLNTGTSFPGLPVVGELFYNSNYKAIYQYDGASWRVMGVTEGAAAPSFAEVGGELFYNVTLNRLYYWNTVEWVSLDVSPNASDLLIGMTKLSLAAADPNNPVAVGTNDPRMLTSPQKTTLTGGGNASSLHSHSGLSLLTGGPSSDASSLHKHGWDYDSGWFTANVNTNYPEPHGIPMSFPNDLLDIKVFWRASSSGSYIMCLNLCDQDRGAADGTGPIVSYDGSNIYIVGRSQFGRYATSGSTAYTNAGTGELRTLAKKIT